MYSERVKTEFAEARKLEVLEARKADSSPRSE
jgi:hypothetical protein